MRRTFGSMEDGITYSFSLMPAKKVILSYRVSPNRDTLSAIKAIDDVLQKFKKIPEHLNLIVDGNPIYLLAQHFLHSTTFGLM
ncbi:hypothetical protein UACE39S_05209 [Ureibacillus acetophenoni]